MLWHKINLLVAVVIFVSWAKILKVQMLYWESVLMADSSQLTISNIPGWHKLLRRLHYYNPKFISSDLDEMVAEGFNWICIWVYWKFPADTGEDVSVMTHDGLVRQMYMDRLKYIISECHTRGIIVDCTFTRDGNGELAGPRNQTEHIAAVQTLAAELVAFRNVYFDLANEHNILDGRYVSLTEIGPACNAVKVMDPGRLCTASGVPASQSELNEYKINRQVDSLLPTCVEMKAVHLRHMVMLNN